MRTDPYLPPSRGQALLIQCGVEGVQKGLGPLGARDLGLRRDLYLSFLETVLHAPKFNVFRAPEPVFPTHPPMGVSLSYGFRLPDTMDMKFDSSLSNNLLIAMPALADPNFSRTVTFICEHSSEGAMGLVINRPTNLKLREILDQLGIETSSDSTPANMPVYFGGPVQNSRGFVLHEPLGNWEATMAVTDTVGISTSRDILEAVANNAGPDRYIVTLGYAGWGAGQLEREITENSWLNTPAAREILFTLPAEQRWKAAARLAGVDLAMLSAEAGHA
jgi:putative transcriptional regulator